MPERQEIPAKMEIGHQLKEFQKRLPTGWTAEISEKNASPKPMTRNNLFFDGYIKNTDGQKIPFKLNIAELDAKPRTAVFSLRDSETAREMLSQVHNLYGKPVFKEIANDPIYGKNYVQLHWLQTSHNPALEEKRKSTVQALIDVFSNGEFMVSELPLPSKDYTGHRIPQHDGVDEQIKEFKKRLEKKIGKGKIKITDQRYRGPILQFKGSIKHKGKEVPFIVSVTKHAQGISSAIVSAPNTPAGENVLKIGLGYVYGEPSYKNSANGSDHAGKPMEYQDWNHVYPEIPKFVQRLKQLTHDSPYFKKFIND